MSQLQIVIVGASLAELAGAATALAADLGKMVGGGAPINAPANTIPQMQPAMQQPTQVFGGAPAAPQATPAAAPQAAPAAMTPGGITLDRVKNAFSEFVTCFGAQQGQAALQHFGYQNIGEANGAQADTLFQYLAQSVQSQKPGVQL